MTPLSPLQQEYLAKQPALDRFIRAMRDQLLELFNGEGLALALPVESRVKTWPSIEEKVQRRSLTPSHLRELTDLVGLRAIFLFRRDLDKATAAVSQTFVIVTQEDTGQRLGESSFGYQSLHLIVRAPPEWNSLPALRGCQEFTMELQLRTLAQHLWAASSHKLQYKQETGVPLPVRRAIHRVSALLETVDLEFERVLLEREAYMASDAPSKTEEMLNVDVLKSILSALLPNENAGNDEPYGELLSDLFRAGVSSSSALRVLIAENLEAAVKMDKERVQEERGRANTPGKPNDRIERGVFFTHVGLARMILNLQFGSTWRAPQSRPPKI